MKKLTIALASVTLALTLAACGGGNSGTDNPLPQGTVSSQPEDSTPAEKATSCDNAREAILTGTQKEINAAMKALVKDKKADATAREAAQDYLNEKDPEIKKMHADLVQLSCSI